MWVVLWSGEDGNPTLAGTTTSSSCSSWTGNDLSRSGVRVFADGEWLAGLCPWPCIVLIAMAEGCPPEEDVGEGPYVVEELGFGGGRRWEPCLHREGWIAESFFGDGSGVYSCGCRGCLPVSLGLDRIPELGDVEAAWWS